MHTGGERMAAKQCRLSDIAQIVNIHNETEICITNTQSESENTSNWCYYDTVYCWFPQNQQFLLTGVLSARNIPYVGRV